MEDKYSKSIDDNKAKKDEMAKLESQLNDLKEENNTLQTNSTHNSSSNNMSPE